MKTKELIELLQKEDPTGECHVRIKGEPIWFMEKKEGYWDGPYNYLEKEDKKYIWVQSTKGNKIDIHTMDLYDFCERYNGDWEEIKKHIRVEYDYLDDKWEKIFIENAKKECEEYNKVQEIIKNN